jgi:hypothetical protein
VEAEWLDTAPGADHCGELFEVLYSSALSLSRELVLV